MSAHPVGSTRVILKGVGSSPRLFSSGRFAAAVAPVEDRIGKTATRYDGHEMAGHDMGGVTWQRIRW